MLRCSIYLNLLKDIFFLKHIFDHAAATSESSTAPYNRNINAIPLTLWPLLTLPYVNTPQLCKVSTSAGLFYFVLACLKSLLPPTLAHKTPPEQTSEVPSCLFSFFERVTFNSTSETLCP